MKIEDIIGVEPTTEKQWVGVQKAYWYDPHMYLSTEFWITLPLLYSKDITKKGVTFRVDDPLPDWILAKENLIGEQYCQMTVYVGNDHHDNEYKCLCDGLSFKTAKEGREFHKQVLDFYEYEKKRQKNPNDKTLKCKWIEEPETILVWKGIKQAYTDCLDKIGVQISYCQNSIVDSEIKLTKINNRPVVFVSTGFTNKDFWFKSDKRAKKFYEQVLFYKEHELKKLENK